MLNNESTQFTPSPSLFQKDSNIIFLIKKAEALSKAIYLVTNLFDDKEPIKFRLRGLAISILESSSQITSVSIFEKDKATRLVSLHVTEVISLFELCRISNLVSEMNFAILKKELISFVNALSSREKADNLGNSFVIPQNLFSQPDLKNNLPVETLNQNSEAQNSNSQSDSREIYKGQVSGTKGQNEKAEATGSVATDKVVIKKEIIPAQAVNKIVKENRSLLPIKDKKLEKQTRKEIIMSLLRKNGNLMIKDFSTVIKDCSEKTIQRELSSMVSQGLLKREGDRRWSKYSINLNLSVTK